MEDGKRQECQRLSIIEIARFATSSRSSDKNGPLSHRVRVASRYWLRLIAAVEIPLSPHAQPLLEESTELIAMLTAIIKTARSNPHRGGAPED